MQQTFLVFLGRFFVFGFFYWVGVLALAIATPGHRDNAFGVFVGGYVLVPVAAAAWPPAAVIARLVNDRSLRFWAHIVSILVFFVTFGFLAVTTFFRHITDGHASPIFTILPVVVIAAMIDGALGAWVDRRRATTHG